MNWLDRTPAPLYPSMCLVLSPKELRKAANSVGMDRPPWPESGARTYEAQEGLEHVCIVALSKQRHTLSLAEICGLLVHKAAHIWQWHCERIGEDAPGAEQEAYALQHIAGRLIEEYMKRASGQATS